MKDLSYCMVVNLAYGTDTVMSFDDAEDMLDHINTVFYITGCKDRPGTRIKYLYYGGREVGIDTFVNGFCLYSFLTGEVIVDKEYNF